MWGQHSIHSVNFKLWVPWEVSWLLINLSFWRLKMNVRQWTKSRLKWGNKFWAKWACEDKYVWVACLFLQLRKPSNFLPVLAASFQQLDLTECCPCSTCWSSELCSIVHVSSAAACTLQATLLNVELSSWKPRHGSHSAVQSLGAESAPRLIWSGWELVPSALKSRWIQPTA